MSSTLPAGPPASDLGRDTAALRSITSATLLAGQKMLVIQHGTEEYRLHLTRSGKLILTK